MGVFTIKTMLGMFELVSRLKVNFYKSCFGAIWVEGEVVERYTHMLNCRAFTLPFVYLGLLIGANPRRKEAWLPIIQKISKKLALWKHKHISFFERICLIIPYWLLYLYFISLSFLNAKESVENLSGDSKEIFVGKE